MRLFIWTEWPNTSHQLAERYSEPNKDQFHMLSASLADDQLAPCQFLEEAGYDKINVQGGMDALE